MRSCHVQMISSFLYLFVVVGFVVVVSRSNVVSRLVISSMDSASPGSDLIRY